MTSTFTLTALPNVMSKPDALVLTISVLLFLGILAISSFRKYLSLPPGPRGLPVIGNLLDFPKQNHGEQFAVMAKKYGMSSK